MNSKKTTNSQLSTTEPKKQKQKLTTRTGTETEKWTSHEGLSLLRERESMGVGKYLGIRSIIGRPKIGGG